MTTVVLALVGIAIIVAFVAYAFMAKRGRAAKPAMPSLESQKANPMASVPPQPLGLPPVELPPKQPVQ